ncbi:MAG: hypothetical protein EOP44_02575, partial [Sphingobacteriaceae bacterium]
MQQRVVTQAVYSAYPLQYFKTVKMQIQFIMKSYFGLLFLAVFFSVLIITSCGGKQDSPQPTTTTGTTTVSTTPV